jgi:hypothetical protein
MKAPGIRAKKSGTKLGRGAALEVMTYPRRTTKSVIVEAARRVKRSVSSFMLSASLEKAARILGRKVKDLVPPDELRQYQKSATTSHTRHVRSGRPGHHPVDGKRSAAAKRAWITIRAKRARMGLSNVYCGRPFPAKADELDCRALSN